MPAKGLARINKAFNEMKADPLSADIISLKGEYHGMFPRRVGSWRIVFGLKPKERSILVADILRADSDDCGQAFRSKPAIDSDRWRTAIPRIPDGVVIGVVMGSDRCLGVKHHRLGSALSE